MGRTPPCSQGVNKGAWTVEEDRILSSYIKAHGTGKWSHVSKEAGLNRCGKSCRLRWLNYLRPDIKRGNITQDEEDLVIRLHKLVGNRWSLIAGRLPGRTDNEIKNYWNTTLRKKVQLGTVTLPHEPEDVGTSAQSQVVRTKATRCNRVLIDPGVHGEAQSMDATIIEDCNGSNSFPSLDSDLINEDMLDRWLMEEEGSQLCSSLELDPFSCFMNSEAATLWPENPSPK